MRRGQKGWDAGYITGVQFITVKKGATNKKKEKTRKNSMVLGWNQRYWYERLVRNTGTEIQIFQCININRQRSVVVYVIHTYIFFLTLM